MSIRENHAYDSDHPAVDNDITYTQRAAILCELAHREDEFYPLSEGFEYFYKWNDYALPLACSVTHEGVTELSEDDYDALFDAWLTVTDLLNIDHHYPFENLNDAIKGAFL
jgi:hypothetical protein